MLTALNSFLERNLEDIISSENDHMILLGDFNWHHLLWEATCNCHLFNYTTANPLIDIIANYGLVQMLPCSIPTLQSTVSGNGMQPNNVFGTKHLLNTVISCNMDPSQRGPKTDHVPIQLILDLETPKMNEEPCKNWQDINWDIFKEHLEQTLAP